MTTPAPAELVQSALLGTDRRPPPDGGLAADPATALLDRAVRWRARRQVAVGLEVVPLGDAPPAAAALPPAPAAARELLDEILLRPGALAVDLWLRAAAAAGVGLAPEHWTPVLDLAARDAGLDRPRLGAVLGERGRGFAAANPDWRRLVGALTGAPAPPRPPPSAADRTEVDLATLSADPDLLFDLADPWSERTCRAGLDLLGSGTLPARAATAYGAAVGARLPLEHTPLVAEAAARHLAGVEPPRYPWSPLSPARAGLLAADDVVATRLLLAAAFEPDRPLPAHRPFPSR